MGITISVKNGKKKEDRIEFRKESSLALNKNVIINIKWSEEREILSAKQETKNIEIEIESKEQGKKNAVVLLRILLNVSKK